MEAVVVCARKQTSWFGQAYLLNLQLQKIRESALQHGWSSLGWHTDLLPAHHSQTKPGEGCTCFRRQSMEAPTAALALRLDCSCRVRTSRRPDWANFRFWKRCFFVSLALNSVHNTIVTCKLNIPIAWSYTTSMISSSTSAKRSVAWPTLRYTDSSACPRKSPV